MTRAEEADVVGPSAFGLHPLDVRAMDTVANVFQTFLEKQEEMNRMERETRLQIVKIDAESRAADRLDAAKERRHEAELQKAEREHEEALQAAEREREDAAQAEERAVLLQTEMRKIEVDHQVKTDLVRRGTTLALAGVVVVGAVGVIGAINHQLAEAGQFVKDIGAAVLAVVGAFLAGRSAFGGETPKPPPIQSPPP